MKRFMLEASGARFSMPKWMSAIQRGFGRWLFVVGFMLCATHVALATSASTDIEARARMLARASAAVVGVHATAVEDAPSIETLGRDREGSGVVIDPEGLVVTIGYLILEAEHVDLELGPDRVVPARVVAYDLASGFGLLQALAPLHVPHAALGNPASLRINETLMIASGGDHGDVSIARLVSRRPYSGYWEYHIEDALFTTPPRMDHSGTALFNGHGELMGIGSLVVLDASEARDPRVPGNMFVPIDLLQRILPELRQYGATRSSTRAWLGLNCVEDEGTVRVVRVTRGSPAEDAGLQPGDRILRIDGEVISTLERFYHQLWRKAPPERDVTLDISRDQEEQSVTVHAKDRMKTLRRAKGI
jgi:S1-C subfamily serine protease